MALVISRKTGESFSVGEAVIYIHEASCGRVRIAIEAPKDIQILRSELHADKEQDRSLLQHAKSGAVRRGGRTAT